jgi:hypothetical protein
LYGRDAEGYVRWLSGDLKNAADIVSNGYENIAELAKIMRKNEYKYLVVEEGYNTDIEKYGYEILTNLDGYNIYRDVQLADIYTLTVSNDREPFVSITDSYGEVLMIDGGSMDNLESVKAYVSQKGGSVHKWILTNANSSKAAVAVLAFAGNQGISVKSYIAPDILSDTYKNQIYQSSESTQIDLWLYDNLAYYENLDWFGSLAENGSELNVLTSKIKVLNAYEESSENVRNNSMVFKFGEDYDNSFIYVSDVTQDIIDSIVDEYADRIESKYLIINNENLSVSYQQIAESMNVQKIINLKDVKDKLEIILE